MTLNRLRYLPANKLQTTLTQLETAATDLKSGAPQFAGSGSFVYAQTDSGNAYDWSGVLSVPDQSSTTFMAQLTITAVAEQANYLVADLIAYLYVGSMSNWYQPSNYLVDLQAGKTPYNIFSYENPINLAAPQQRQWIVVISGPNTDTCYCKVWVLGNDSVSLTVEGP